MNICRSAIPVPLSIFESICSIASVLGLKNIKILILYSLYNTLAIEPRWVFKSEGLPIVLKKIPYRIALNKLMKNVNQIRQGFLKLYFLNFKKFP